MLIKHGFFNLLDTSSEEVFWKLKENNKSHFTLVENHLVNEQLIAELRKDNSHFLITGQISEKKTHLLSTLFGVSSVISFPFPSARLAQKIIERSN